MFFLPATESKAQTVDFDHLTYLSGNLDSLVRVYLQLGFTVTPYENVPRDVVAFRIWLPDSTFLQLEGTASTDTSDWRVKAIHTFNTHISDIGFRVTNLKDWKAQLDSSIVGSTGPVIETKEGASFGLRLDVVPSELTLTQYKPEYWQRMMATWQTKQHARIGDSVIELPPYHHTNRSYRVHWLLLTAALPVQKTALRRVFEVFRWRKLNDGFYDYWLSGSLDHRQCLRFEIPDENVQPNQLSIEEDGVLFAY